MIDKLLILILSIEIASLVLVDKILDIDLQWKIFLLLQYSVYFISTICIFSLVSYRDIYTKFLSLLAVLFSVWWLADHIILSFLTQEYLEIFRSFSSIIIGLLSVPFVLYIIFKKHTYISDKYKKEGCYIVYRKPRSILSLVIASFRHDNTSSCFGVDDGTRYFYKKDSIFHKGILIKKKHLHNSEFIYKKVPKVMFDSLLSSRLGRFRTCFKIFEL